MVSSSCGLDGVLVSEPHGDGWRRRLQLLVQQPEGHGGPVALQRLAQQVVQLSLQVVDVSQALPAVQLAEVSRRLLQGVQGQAPLVCKRRGGGGEEEEKGWWAGDQVSNV